MDLLEYCDEFVAEPSLRDLPSRATRLWDQAYSVIGNESRTDPTIAAVLSQIVMLTDEFTAALKRRNLDPKDESSSSPTTISKSTAPEEARRYALVTPRSSWR